MLKRKVKILALTLVLVLLLVPVTLVQADEHGTAELNLEEYNLDYLAEEELETLKTVLGNLKDADVLDEEKLDAIIADLEMDEEDEDTEEDNFGQDLSSSIEEFKNENEDWTGEQLANHVQNFIIENREDIVPEEARNKIKAAKENKEKAEEKKEEAQENKGGETEAKDNSDNAEDKGNGGY